MGGVVGQQAWVDRDGSGRITVHTGMLAVIHPALGPGMKEAAGSCDFPHAGLRRVASCRSLFPRPMIRWFDSGPSRIRGKDRGEAGGSRSSLRYSRLPQRVATGHIKSVWLFDCYTPVSTLMLLRFAPGMGGSSTTDRAR